MRIQSDNEPSVEVDLAPLIDCVFLLLIFFLVAASLKVIEYQAELPQSAPAGFGAEVSGKSQIVEISESGRFRWADKKYTIKKTASLLEGIKNIMHDLESPDIEIRAHPNTPAGSVLLLVDALRVAGVNTVDVRLVTDVQ